MAAWGRERTVWRDAGRAGRALLFAVLLIPSASGLVRADDLRYLRVGTGPPAESYFPIGGLIAGAISNPPGAPSCERGGSCGVPDLIAVATATGGSVANIEAIRDGRLDIALVQADVAMWAAQGTGPFRGRAVDNLRSIANLYPSQFHLVARPEARIQNPGDLKGKRVSLGEAGSGTLLHARQMIAAWNIRESDIKVRFLRSALAADAMSAGSLDAFFVIDRAPVPAVGELAKRQPIRLVPIAGEGAEKLKKSNPLLIPSIIAGGLYDGTSDDVPTLQLGISLVAAAELPDDLVWGITKALWHPATTAILAESLSQGTQIRLATALSDLGVPLHPGAARFYRENQVAR